MELIEPTVKRAFDDHETVKILQMGHEFLKKKFEEHEQNTYKHIQRAVTQEDLSRKLSELVSLNKSLINHLG